MMKLTVFAIALAAALPNVSAARDVGTDVHVSYADLDLRTAPGVRMLDRRLARAIRLVCWESDAGPDQARKSVVRRCDTIKRAEVATQRQRVLAEVAMRGETASSAP